MRIIFLVSTIVLLLFHLGCAEEEIMPVVLPTNLQVSVNLSENVEGLLLVTAAAQNANYFSFEFIQNGESQNLEATDGKVAFQFTTSGTHKYIVRAHTTFDRFIRVEDSIEVKLSENPSGFPSTGYETPMSYPGYTLVWHDEFDGTSLSTDWVYDLGTGNNGWGNNELQFYRQENAEVRDGALVITAKQEAVGGRQYTSSRVKTQGKQSFTYGRIDIRAALPQGQGIWPATWMLGDAFSSTGWPSCGEIDIMELVGGGANDRIVHGTAHWSNANNTHTFLGGSNIKNGSPFAENWHVFSIEWDAQKIIWYRDDIKYFELPITSPEMSEFHQPFFFILNVAVGGNWPGDPNNTTVFPQRMAVDYVRVFQK